MGLRNRLGTTPPTKHTAEYNVWLFFGREEKERAAARAFQSLFFFPLRPS